MGFFASCLKIYLLFGINYYLKHFVTFFEANTNPHRPLNAVNNDFFHLGAVWSGSALFAQTSLSETLGSIRYFEACTIYAYMILTIVK